MQALLADIELDVHELKCVIDALSQNSGNTLREVARRNVLQMRARLDQLLEELENEAQPSPVAEEKYIKEKPAEIPVPQEEVEVGLEMPAATVSILAERIKPGADLCRSISLNDSFRFSRELFSGDTARMNLVLQQIGEMSSLDAAVAFLSVETRANEENEAMADLMELLRKYFK